jgi:hypothetical protein
VASNWTESIAITKNNLHWRNLAYLINTVVAEDASRQEKPRNESQQDRSEPSIQSADDVLALR